MMVYMLRCGIDLAQTFTQFLKIFGVMGPCPSPVSSWSVSAPGHGLS
jgi:hypothetical protein